MTRTAFFHIPFTRQEVYAEYPSRTTGRFFQLDRSEGDTQIWLGQLYLVASPLRDDSEVAGEA